MMHVIAPGETLGKIAARYGVTVAAIAAANGIADPNRIAAGRVLTIPGATITARPVTVTAGGSAAPLPPLSAAQAQPVPVIAPASGSWLSTLLSNAPAVAQTYADTKRAVVLNKIEAERLRADSSIPLPNQYGGEAAETAPGPLPVWLIVGAAGLALFLYSRPKGR